MTKQKNADKLQNNMVDIYTWTTSMKHKYNQWNADNTDNKDQYINNTTQRVEQYLFCTPYELNGKATRKKTYENIKLFDTTHNNAHDNDNE